MYCLLIVGEKSMAHSALTPQDTILCIPCIKVRPDEAWLRA